MVVALVVGLPAGSACGSAAKTVLGRAHQTGRLLSNANLLEILQGRLSLRRIRARTTVLAVTIAEYLQVLEPFRVRLDRGADPRLRHRNPDEPGFHLQWYARYLNLCDLDDEGAALELLRQTSALPLLVESGVTESGGSSVDGGVADNMPLWPVCAAGAEYVIVVDLNPRPQRFTYYSEHLKKTWMAQLLADMPEAQATSLYREWFRRWEADKRADGADLLPEAPVLRADQLIILKPSKALATIDWPVLRFLTGTLNLSQRARATWMELGFEDTLRAFGVKVTTNPADS